MSRSTIDETTRFVPLSDEYLKRQTQKPATRASSADPTKPYTKYSLLDVKNDRDTGAFTVRRRHVLVTMGFGLLFTITVSLIVHLNVKASKSAQSSKPNAGNTANGGLLPFLPSPGINMPAMPNDDRMPVSPTGATLVQFAPCLPRTNATIPMFVNKFWSNGDADVTSAYLSQHGRQSDFDVYYAHAYPLVGQNSVLVAPGFYRHNSEVAPRTWYQPRRNLAWTSQSGSWTVGTDAVSPLTGTNHANTSDCSSFDAFDAILARLADKSLFPRLANVYFVGHSGGANMVSRYAQLSNLTNAYESLHIHYVVMNAASQAYFGTARPSYEVRNCAPAFRYPNQLTNEDGSMPRYVREQFDAVLSGGGSDADKATAMMMRWLSRDVALLVGNRDTTAAGATSCVAMAQGSVTRRDRNYAFWACENLIAHTNTDVSQYSGYSNLSRSIATSGGSGDGMHFAHRICIVDGAGHNARTMFNSECGRAALLNRPFPSGNVPLYPERNQP